MKQALIFDLDGTLWDALLPITNSWNKAMKKNKKPYSFNVATIKTFMGLTPEETAVIAFPDVSLLEGMNLFALCLEEEIMDLATIPGTLYNFEREVLEKLSAKYDLFIVSNCDKGYIENYLNAHKMNKYFADHTCIGDTGLPKWKNIIFLKNKYHIDDIIYIGDTEKDKIESNKAGVKFIHATYGFGNVDNDKYYIDSLLDLPDKVEELFNY
ncbi:MAG: HAD family hydrolase [Bacilli bacterium]